MPGQASERYDVGAATIPGSTDAAALPELVALPPDAALALYRADAAPAPPIDVSSPAKAE